MRVMMPQGVAAVEMALLAPVVLGALVATIELGLVLVVNIGIEAAVRDAARYGITGQGTAVAREAAIRNIIAGNTFGLVDMDTISISTKVYPNFASAGKVETYTDTNTNGQWDVGEPFTDLNGNGTFDGDLGTPGVGNAGEVVLYTISYGLPLIAAATRDLFGTDALSLATRIVVRNEPWNPT
jgi:Flp pilus assembly protein TadG